MKKNRIVLSVSLVLAVLALVYSGTLINWIRRQTHPSTASHRSRQAAVDAQAFIDSGDLRSAERVLLKDFNLNDYDERSFYLLSFIYVFSGDMTQAFKYAKPLAEKTVDPKILTDLGSLFAMAGYDQMAFACYSKSLAADQGYIAAYVELGKLYGNQNKFVQAISVWQDGLRIDPANKEMIDLIRQANTLWQASDQTAE